jgi:large subunit ribosomal protein L18
MISKKSSSDVRRNKHRRLRNHLSGTSERPRLAVFRSNNHMYARLSTIRLATPSLQHLP